MRQEIKVLRVLSEVQDRQGHKVELELKDIEVLKELLEEVDLRVHKGLLAH